MSNENKAELVFEDISSSTPKNETLTDKYVNKAVTNIDKTIKVISFIVAIGIFLIFAAVAGVLVLLDKVFLIVAVGVAVIGIVIAIISLFIIYGIGHIITQNNEILKKL